MQKEVSEEGFPENVLAFVAGIQLLDSFVRLESFFRQILGRLSRFIGLFICHLVIFVACDFAAELAAGRTSPQCEFLRKDR